MKKNERLNPLAERKKAKRAKWLAILLAGITAAFGGSNAVKNKEINRLSGEKAVQQTREDVLKKDNANLYRTLKACQKELAEVKKINREAAHLLSPVILPEELSSEPDSNCEKCDASLNGECSKCKAHREQAEKEELLQKKEFYKACKVINLDPDHLFAVRSKLGVAIPAGVEKITNTSTKVMKSKNFKSR